MGVVQKCENFIVLEKIMLKNAYLGAKIGFDTAAALLPVGRPGPVDFEAE